MYHDTLEKTQINGLDIFTADRSSLTVRVVDDCGWVLLSFPDSVYSCFSFAPADKVEYPQPPRDLGPAHTIFTNSFDSLQGREISGEVGSDEGGA